MRRRAGSRRTLARNTCKWCDISSVLIAWHGMRRRKMLWNMKCSQSWSIVFWAFYRPRSRMRIIISVWRLMIRCFCHIWPSLVVKWFTSVIFSSGPRLPSMWLGITIATLVFANLRTKMGLWGKVYASRTLFSNNSSIFNFWNFSR